MAIVKPIDRPPSRPLRIAMVVPPWYELPPAGYGGIEAMCSVLIDKLSDRGHDVVVLGAGSRCGTAGTFVSLMDEPQHQRLGEVMPAALHAARVGRILRRGAFDVVHDHSPAGPLTAYHHGSPTVVTVHGSPVGELGDFLANLDDRVRPVAISRSQRQSRPDLDWLATVHNAVDLSQFVARPATDGPALWLARMSPDKGADLAIEACRRAGVPLVLAGKCSEPAERRYFDSVIRPMLGDDVEVVLDADRQTSLRLLARSRCLILPIRWEEPFGMVMIEAMASGRPVVALRRGSVPEVVVDGVTGWICDTVDDLPAALHRTPELDPQACVAHVRAAFGADLMAHRYEVVYRRATDQARRAGARRPATGRAALPALQAASSPSA
ncbi:glycosyl transferase [Pilimelia terevasa]|uniref:Glycosyl transferase n=1 Tax=Pilimelia terevasa TaxID=53372 RepID=A0A8J3FM18_9ACTN|nr:glycosyltransferase family 4 protein [Pilimelia terevasa]GGK42062.1 glycosyl transferase [Pilimelia terevasa]